jgi:AcrR family transcriptional regulator
MNDIVKESGVSKGGVYWHFKSKDEIIRAIFEYFFDIQLQFVTATLQSEGAAAERLERIFRLSGQEVEASMPQPLEFYALAARDDVLKQRLSAYFEAYRQPVITLIQQGIDDGEFEASDPSLVAVNIISLLEGIILVGLAIPHTWNFQAQMENAINMVLNGLTKRS